MASRISPAYARDLDILDIRSSGVSSQEPPRPCSPSTVCTALDTVHPFFAVIYGCGQSKNRGINEINRLLPVNRKTNANPQLAYSNSVIIWYSHPRAIKYNRIKQNFPRLPLPREHPNATTKAYAIPRDWSVHGGDTKSKSYPPYSTASVDSQGDGV